MLDANAWLERGQLYFPAEFMKDGVNLKKDEYLQSFHSNHGPDWLSLIILSALMDKEPEKVLNQWAIGSGVREIPKLDSIKKAQVKKVFAENLPYRSWLYAQMEQEIHHLNPSERHELAQKMKAWEANLAQGKPELGPGLEGTTESSFCIEGEMNQGNAFILFETKYMKDISVKTTYNPVRDRLIRVIDAAIYEFRLQKRDLSEFWFFLLSPAAFKPDGMGPVPMSPLRLFPGASNSRLYANKIKEYIKPENLKAQLPHWGDAELLKEVSPELKPMTDQEWRLISDRIGWVTFEGFLKVVLKYLEDPFKSEVEEYFADRGMHQ